MAIIEKIVCDRSGGRMKKPKCPWKRGFNTANWGYEQWFVIANQKPGIQGDVVAEFKTKLLADFVTNALNLAYPAKKKARKP
jgi:hypothetical protein